MKLTINEKKTLYAFGCPNRQATVKRLCLIADISPEPTTFVLLHRLADKLADVKTDEWYRCFFRTLQQEIKEYHEAETAMRLAEMTAAGLEDYLDEAEQV